MKKIFLFALLLFGRCGFSQSNSALLQKLLRDSGDSTLQAVMAAPERFQLQLIYTQIDRDEDNHPAFTTHYLGVDSNLYFYPASTVKMPAAFLALEKLNELRIQGLDAETPMFTGKGQAPQTAVRADTSAAQGLPSVAHYIKKIFLVSDNDAYNRLYEFLGQAYLNEKLQEKGYTRSRIIHRLSAPGYDAESNRYTNPVTFTAPGNRLLYHQGEVYSSFDSPLQLKQEVRGQGFMDGEGQIVPAPFDFRDKNYVGLQDLHDMLQAVLFPEAVPAHRRFNLTPADYQFLRRYMSMLPRESDYPAYPQYTDWDSYVKFFLFGDSKSPIPDHIRIFNKVGDAYGFLTDVAYVVDDENKVEFMVAANIHVNANQIYNDGVYEYDTIGFPALAQIGRILYQYELKRERQYEPVFPER
ncbi:MAG: serine hydrolase [Phaeodactylibacter sp.]|uniref:serine hydrolase n=1 Tax=Phaeodactylibacter sp. TaxID=1940289 RepID=UPI0032EB2109